jgi:hypothetical protein
MWDEQTTETLRPLLLGIDIDINWFGIEFAAPT